MIATDVPNVPTVSAEYQKYSEKIFSSDDTQKVVREAVLRHLVGNSIKANEQAGVTTSVKIVELKDDHSLVTYSQDTEHFAASINKLPVALLLLEDLRAGRLSLDQTMTWLPSDVRGGYGNYDQPGAPTQATLREVIYDMLNKSGNTVVRVAVNYALGGATEVNTRWAAKPQLSHTYLQPLDASRFYLGFTTPHDSLWTMQQLMKHQDVYARFMKDAMSTNIFTDFGVRSSLAGNDYIVLVNKIGLLDDVDGNNRHDVGVIYNTRNHKSYAYSLMTTTPYDNADGTALAGQSLKDIGGYTLRFAGDREKTDTQPSTLRLFSQQSQQPEAKILY